MTSKNLSEIEEPGYIHLIIARIERLRAKTFQKLNDETQALAKKMHDALFIYYLYNLLDAISLTSSLFKYLFDIFLSNSSLAADAMHDWMITPTGLILTAGTAIALVTFSLLAIRLDDDDKNIFKRWLATIYAHCRDIIKGLKNAYKGFRSTAQIIGLLGGQSLNALIIPVGLLLGGLAVINRIWYRQMLEQRKSMMKANTSLLAILKNSTDLTLDNIYSLAQTQVQTKKTRAMSLASAAYGGIVDGMYLYAGILGLCALAPPVLVAMSVFTAIYVVTCIATRVYEEYHFQRKLVISQAKVDLARSGKKIELFFAELQALSKALARSPDNQVLLAQQANCMFLLEQEYEQFQEHKKNLRSLSTLYFTSAFLIGARNGLGAYGALASVLFGLAIIFTLTSTSFPPALLIASVSLGMGLLIGFIAHSLISAYRHQQKQEMKDKQEKKFAREAGDISNANLSGIKSLLKNIKSQNKELKAEQIRATILDDMTVDPSPQFFFQEWFEIIRSFFSGVGKGTKAITLALNPLQMCDEAGHYHETPIMLGFMVVSALIHAVILALRAFCRAFGKPAIDEIPDAPADVVMPHVATGPDNSAAPNPDEYSDDEFSDDNNSYSGPDKDLCDQLNYFPELNSDCSDDESSKESADGYQSGFTFFSMPSRDRLTRSANDLKNNELLSLTNPEEKKVEEDIIIELNQGSNPRSFFGRNALLSLSKTSSDGSTLHQMNHSPRNQSVDSVWL